MHCLESFGLTWLCSTVLEVEERNMEVTIQITNCENRHIWIFVCIFIDTYTNTYIFIACLCVTHEASLNGHCQYDI